MSDIREEFVYNPQYEDAEAPPARENATPGTVAAVLVDIVPIGFTMQEPFEKGGVAREVFQLDIIFQIEEETSKGYRFTPRRRLTLSLHEKATFRKYYEALVGRKVTADEESGKTKVTVKGLFPLIGTSVLLELVTSPDAKYTNINAIMPLPKGMPTFQAKGYMRVKDRDKAN